MSFNQRYFLLLLIDSIIIVFSVLICYFMLSPMYQSYTIENFTLTFCILLISHNIFAYVFNIYHRAWEYASVRELVSIFECVTLSVIATYIMTYIIFNLSFFRLMVTIWMMLLILIGGSRLSWRIFRNKIIEIDSKDLNAKRTLVVGAGRGGTMLIRQLLEIPALGMKPVIAIDDDMSKQKLQLAGGIKVVGTRNDIPRLVKKFEIEKIVIAIPSLSKKELNKITEIASKCSVEVFIMPNIDDVLAGRIEVSRLKKVEVEDLLGREPVVLDTVGIEDQIQGKIIAVTGAGGSIGSEIVRQITKFQPQKVLLIGHGENSIYLILEELKLIETSIEFIPIIADIQDERRMESVFLKFNPDIVYHAAAHKHVPLMEYNPIESVKNNIIGTKIIAEASIKCGVKKFVMISTDKAVNPPNVMGATKRIAEMIIQNLDKIQMNTTLVAVRFGNVLGSRGSVIPKFRKQIETGGPITITDERMTRYFMTIPEASRLVIQAGALAKGGEVFVLDMGEPVKIVDLAKQMIKLSGFKEEEIGIKYTGIRPGEKLYEELLAEGEIHDEQVYKKIYRGNVTVPQSFNSDLLIEKLLNSKNLKEDLIEIANKKS